MLIKPSLFWKFRYQIVTFFWFLLGFRAAFIEIILHKRNINNFLIYKHVYFNAINKQNLYIEYPLIYSDSNHYGPLFSLIILPFAVLPTVLGCFLWCFFAMLVLWVSINHLAIKQEYKIAILLISSIEMQTAIHDTQFNPICAGLIVLSFVFVKRGYVFWGALFVMTGFLIKLYGLVGICFILFTDKKLAFAKYLLLCFLALLVLPMIISTPDFVVNSYFEWTKGLLQKNVKNIDILDKNLWQDISVMGFIRRVFNLPHLSNLYVLIPAALINLAILLRFKAYKSYRFQLSVIALFLLEVVIFSSSSEAASYIIAAIGVGIWFILQSNKKSAMVLFLLFCCFFVSNFVSYHLLPDYRVENYYNRYSLKVLPFFMVWVVLISQLAYNSLVGVKSPDFD